MLAFRTIEVCADARNLRETYPHFVPTELADFLADLRGTFFCGICAICGKPFADFFPQISLIFAEPSQRYLHNHLRHLRETFRGFFPADPADLRGVFPTDHADLCR